MIVSIGNLERIKRLAYILCTLISRISVEIWHDDHKFLAAIPTGKITAPALLRKSDRKCLENFVTRFMPIGVVDSFEMVEIDHNDANRIIFARGARKLTLQRLFEITPVEKIG